MTKQTRNKVVFGISFGFFGIIIIFLLMLLMPLSSHPNMRILVHEGDSIDVIYAQLDTMARPPSKWMFHVMTNLTGYDKHIKAGIYDCSKQSTWQTFRRMRHGSRMPMKLVITTARTKEDLAGKLAKMLVLNDSAELSDTFSDTTICARCGVTPETVIGLFLPNTYEVFCPLEPGELVYRMKRESDRFWTEERLQQAEAQGLTAMEVMTLASIVDRETNNAKEKPWVAGMYLNRLRKGMPLQADPTIIFAHNDFSIRRVTGELLQIDSPYNTYKNKGLPPGPIGIPDLKSIEAVLKPATHNYLYMCAKEDFSGTHNFAETFAEHQQNARKYAAALNAKGITE